MLLEGKYSRPVADIRDLHLRSLRCVTESNRVLVQAAPGYLVTESLAALLEDMEHPFVWLRFSEDDFDPARCLSDLIIALQGLFPDIGKHILEKIQLTPGPLQDWSALYTSLAAELAEATLGQMVLVLDHLHYLSRFPPTLQILGRNFVLRLPVRVQVIMTSQEQLPKGISQKLPPGVTTKDLRLNRAEVSDLFQFFGLGLPAADIQRVRETLQGNAGGLVGLCRTGQLLGESYLHEQIRLYSDWHPLLRQLSWDCVAALSAEQRLTLWTLIYLGYYHPLVFPLKSKDTLPPRGPWVQFLEHGWSRSYCLWIEPLLSNLKACGSPGLSELSQFASQLCEHGSPVEGINILFNLGLPAEAALAIDQRLPDLIGEGLWETLANWFDRLPTDRLGAHPWLLQASGEMKASEGKLGLALKDLRLATKSFSRRKDLPGLCTNLLAQSTLECHRTAYPRARDYALKARTLAQKTGNERAEGWAEYQLGIVAGRQDDLTGVRGHFQRAAEIAVSAGDETLQKTAQPIVNLVAELEHGQLKARELRLSMQEVEKRQAVQTRQLKRLIESPLQNLEDTMNSQNWLQAPFMFNIFNTVGVQQTKDPGWLRRLQRHFANQFGALRKEITALQSSADEFIPLTGMDSLPADIPNRPQLTAEAGNFGGIQAEIDWAYQTPSSTPEAAFSNSRVSQSLTELVPVPANPGLIIYCLNRFRVFKGEQFVENWSSRKAQMIFKYLLLHRQAPVPKDVLMDRFWPDSDAESARRSLHQAIYTLRQTLKGEENALHYIQFENDGYGINPDLKIWIDFEYVSLYFQAGQKLERIGEIQKAVECYRNVDALYENHLFAEDLYEEWIQPHRLKCWQQYQIVFHRMVEYNLQTKDFTAAIALCQRGLILDPCLEEAHRTLMFCFLHQGQRQLAIRQYHLCVQALQEELSVSPSAETIQLYKALQIPQG